MRIVLAITLFVGVCITPEAHAVHPLPQVPNTCTYNLATPHRPDPRTLEAGATAEQRCRFADTFAISNTPTVPVAVISPSGESRFYCTTDGSTLATPLELDQDAPELAETLTGAKPCAGDRVCTDLFGADASCEAFGPDASGRSEDGWTSSGPANSITLASDLAGQLGAHSVYIRSSRGDGNIFYFTGGMNRTHSLTAPDLNEPGDLPVLDITICQALNSPVVQRTRPPDCEGFFCRPIPCCGPHFPCDGEPNLPPLVSQSPEEPLAELDLELEWLAENGRLNTGQANGMRRRIVNIFKSLDKGKAGQACNHLDQLIRSFEQNVRNGSMLQEDADPLTAAGKILRIDLGCT